MIKLVPGWAYDYPEFWSTIRRRNLWLIKIRYLASLSVLAFLLLGEYLLDFQLNQTQIIAFIIIAISIFLYNVIIHLIRPKVGTDPIRFNALHLSLVQMILDLSTLMLVIYFTGIIESPLHVFFIFHMVIGSLILPGILIKAICVIYISIYALLVFLQRVDIVDTFLIKGISENVVRPWNYDILFIVVFASMMIITVLITNQIAKNLLRREEQLRQTLLKLNEVEKSKQKYLIGVVHEIKTPITAIKSIVDIILQKFLGPVSEPVEDKLIRIRERSNEGLYLINSILKISKLKLLEKRDNRKIFIGEIIADYVENHSDDLKSKRITISINDKRKFRRPVSGDEELLQLAISNIMSNSAKYVGEGGLINITIEYEEQFLRIEFADNGIGIPEKDLPRIFDQFYRASNTRRHKSEGSGLGLSLVKEIINHHSGTIEVESPSGIGDDKHPGSSFIIKLPYIIEEDDRITSLEPLSGGL
ncbi:MAG: HAMP domain-containing histidine kinase [Melioribacteraceae bacterium]|nr:HAMP domain-containing histidine kinase [Melioribacteraceae bacterium]